MASARIARLATEAAPPQIATVMRQRASKMLDTIHEEDQSQSQSQSQRDVPAASDSTSLPPNPTNPNSHHLQPSSSSSSSPIMPQKFVLKAFKGRISLFSR